MTNHRAIILLCCTHLFPCRAAIHSLLAKEAIEVVLTEHRESGQCSHYFLVPKKDAGLHPILDLRSLNRASKALMIIVKQILVHIQPGV